MAPQLYGQLRRNSARVLGTHAEMQLIRRWDHASRNFLGTSILGAVPTVCMRERDPMMLAVNCELAGSRSSGSHQRSLRLKHHPLVTFAENEALYRLGNVPQLYGGSARSWDRCALHFRLILHQPGQADMIQV